MKYIYCLLGLICLSIMAKAQTNVSGGIYLNATWKKANSPYIVVDTVVVFPGATLTINPGVVVKFADKKRIEIRQASIIALGTPTDSIVFTSNSSAPAPGSWAQIFLNGGSMPASFHYCRFHYATNAIEFSSYAPIGIKNCEFSFNNIGLKNPPYSSYGPISIDSTIFAYNTNHGCDLRNYGYSSGPASAFMLVNHCLFSNNGTGLSGQYKKYAVVRNSIFRNNTVGLVPRSTIIDSCIFSQNVIGIESGSGNILSNCAIDSNTQNGIQTVGDTVRNCVIRHNYVGMYSSIVMLYNSVIENNQVNIRHRGSTARNQFSIIANDTIRGGVIGLDSIPGNYFVTKNVIVNNSIGIRLSDSGSVITCNKICSNSSYDLRHDGRWNTTVALNYWCADSGTTRSRIYDGYTNVNSGLVTFMPMDSTCYLPVANPVAVPGTTKAELRISPNPASAWLNIELPATNGLKQVTLYDLLGRQQYHTVLSGNNGRIDISALPCATYILQVSGTGTFIRKRIVKQ